MFTKLDPAAETFVELELLPIGSITLTTMVVDKNSDSIFFIYILIFSPIIIKIAVLGLMG
jgi:hypothetical protein